MLREEAAAAPAQLERVERRAVVDEYRAFLYLLGGALEALPLLALLAAALEELYEVHLRLGGEHSLRYLLRGHFKAEYEDGDVLLASGVLPDVEREGRLSHGGTRRDDVERAGL